MKTTVLMGDIVGSRKMNQQQRYELQERFNNALGDLSAKYKSSLGTPMGLLAGDAYRVVIDDPSVLPDLLVAVAAACRPHRVRQAVGVGGVFTRQVEDPHRLDGPAFHNARDAIDLSEDIVFIGLGSTGDTILTGLMALLLAHQARLTETQLPVFQLLIDDCSPKEIEARLNLSKQSVYQYKERIQWSAYAKARTAMSEAINLFFKDVDV